MEGSCRGPNRHWRRMRRGGSSPGARARGRRWGTARAGRWYRCAGALVDALARPPWGGQPRADFADGRNRLNREGGARRTGDGRRMRGSTSCGGAGGGSRRGCRRGGGRRWRGRRGRRRRGRWRRGGRGRRSGSSRWRGPGARKRWATRSATAMMRLAAARRGRARFRRASIETSSPSGRVPRQSWKSMTQPATVVPRAAALKPISGARPSATRALTIMAWTAKRKGVRVSSRA